MRPTLPPMGSNYIFESTEICGALTDQNFKTMTNDEVNAFIQDALKQLL